jgi:hypothetical protein
MSPRRELLTFSLVLAALVALFFHRSLFGGKVLSPADVLYAQRSFPGKGDSYEPANRLLIDPVLQFQPWLAFNRAELRAGRLPLWNPFVGCGAPHLANAQSGVFDPIHLLAYFGSLPEAFGWMAAVRLWIAGIGMYLLIRGWGLGAAGRWFAGLVFPFCGFLIVWLEYPVTAAAIWLPWLLWASDRFLERPGPRPGAMVALFTALPCLAGHVQTAAHVLLATGLYVVFQSIQRCARRPIATCGGWIASVGLGVGLAGVQILPLGAYLAESPVWSDRLVERTGAGPVHKPRLLDSLCTVAPYLFGSQRQGHPNVARALGVHNLNESAGGFAGTPTWLLLVPLGLAAWRTQPRVRFWLIMLVLGIGLAFAIPPLPHLLDPVPVLNVIDHRRTTLWLAFAQVVLAAFGIDRLVREGCRLGRAALVSVLFLALLLAGMAVGLHTQRERIGALVEARLSARQGAGRSTDPARFERHIRNAWRFYPSYFAALAAELGAMAVVVAANRSGRFSTGASALVLTALTLGDLFAFGYGMNPEIERADAEPASPVIERLRQLAPFPARILAIDSELPPNTLMRYGLCDLRNYDSIEMRSIVDHFAGLFAGDSSAARTSRREVDWPAILSERTRLVMSGVRAIVSRSEPPEPFAARAERVGAVWLTPLEGPALEYVHRAPGEIRIDASHNPSEGKLIPVTFDPGWIAEVDGRPVELEASNLPFVALPVQPVGAGEIRLRYEPLSVRLGAVLTGTSLLVWIGLFAGGSAPQNRRNLDVEGLEARVGGR